MTIMAVRTRGYDPNLAKATSVLDGEVPTLWPQFEALSRIPAMAIRGELSDILSPQTLSDMRLRHPDLVTWTVKQQGHAPLLRDRPTMFAINDFLARADVAGTQAPEQRRRSA